MKDTTLTSKHIIRQLDDGLVIRHGSPADADQLSDFNARVHSDAGWEQPEEGIGVWTRDLLTKPHPTMQPEDFSIVEDTRSGKIVSTMNLIPQTWSYSGIEFGVGRPEMVATHPDYRRRGLIRAQFEIIHQWSAARGHMLQAITGIPWYYRMFGYEMAVDLGGGRAGLPGAIPALKEAEQEPFNVRTAFADDLAFIAQLYDEGQERYLLRAVRGVDIWRYELEGRSPDNLIKKQLRIIERPNGEPVGYLAHRGSLVKGDISVLSYELKTGVSWWQVSPSVLRYLKETGQAYAKRDGQNFEALSFGFGRQHPLFEAIPDWLPIERKPYAWFLRVADLPAFLTRIKPVLEQRLADSVLCGHSGELTISFYQDGLRLVFEDGAITIVQRWLPGQASDPAEKEPGMVVFPPLTFLQLLFGYRSFDQLEQAFPDCYAHSHKHPEARPLVNALFPVQPSLIMPLA